MSELPVLKYIVTDDYKPLYALQKIHGPARGPIRTPVRVDIPTIEELLKQNSAAKLFEVIPVDLDERGHVIFSNRVELTLENFKLSWFTLHGEDVPVINGKRLKNVDVYTPPIKEDKIDESPNACQVPPATVPDNSEEFESSLEVTGSDDDGSIATNECKLPDSEVESSKEMEETDTSADTEKPEPVISDEQKSKESSTEPTAPATNYRSNRRR